jgi:tRNA(His) 5'-end guanylyltransferase
MTAEFNLLRYQRAFDVAQNFCKDLNKQLIKNLAYFDCRTFTIPDRVEVMNYFRWRQADCIRNSVSMVAQNVFSHKDLHGKSQSMMHEMLHQKGVNWATDFTDGEKNGRFIGKVEYKVEDLDINSKQWASKGIRTRWISTGAWVFTKDEGKLLTMIPNYSV